MKRSSFSERPGVVRSRVLDIDLYQDGEEKYVPMRIEVFYRNTVFRVRARVCPRIAWLQLLAHILDELHERLGAVVPGDRLRYFIMNAHTKATVVPMGMMSDTFTDHIICVHHSEFGNALDRGRRAMLLADMLKAMPWPPRDDESVDLSGDDFDAAEAAPAAEPSAPDGSDAETSEVEATSGDEASPRPPERAHGLDVMESDPAEPDAAVDVPNGGAWTKWHRSYAPSSDPPPSL